MRDIPDDELRRLPDHVTMACKIDRLGPCRQPLQRSHVVAHASIRRGHDRGRPAHHVITGKQYFGAFESESYMVRGMSWRSNHFERPAIPRDHVTVGDPMVRDKIAIAASVESFGLAD